MLLEAMNTLFSLLAHHPTLRIDLDTVMTLARFYMR